LFTLPSKHAFGLLAYRYRLGSCVHSKEADIEKKENEIAKSGYPRVCPHYYLSPINAEKGSEVIAKARVLN
jgi:hypothetical protein